jgi:hypothetical protein
MRIHTALPIYFDTASVAIAMPPVAARLFPYSDEPGKSGMRFTR